MRGTKSCCKGCNSCANWWRNSISCGSITPNTPYSKLWFSSNQVRMRCESLAVFKWMTDMVDYGWICFEMVDSWVADTAGLRDSVAIELLQDQTQMMLQEYCTQHPTFTTVIPSRHSMVSSRFGKLLLLLPAFRSVRHSSVRDLFFRQLIGDIPITRLLSDVMGTFWGRVEIEQFTFEPAFAIHPVNSSRLFRNGRFPVSHFYFHRLRLRCNPLY